MMRSNAARKVLIFAETIFLSVIFSIAADGANGTLLRQEVGLYPRAIRLEHGGAANGRIIAGVVTFAGNNGLGAIYESADDGASFTQIGTISDWQSANGRGLCCATLFELPRKVGKLPAGTLLWAASTGQDTPNRRMAIRVWKSKNQGRDWTYLSTVAVAPNTHGLWEPEFSVDAGGRLVCHFADETDPRYSQKLSRVRTSNGKNWVNYSDTVASSLSSDRPGMPVVRKLSNGTYLMSYEVCTPNGQYRCAAHYRTSADGWNWGEPAYLGIRPETADGRYFRHAPTIALSRTAAPNGVIFLVGQILVNADGTVAAGNGRTIFTNSDNGAGVWTEINAPVAVVNPFDNYCPNYSSSLLTSNNGANIFEIATDYDGKTCKAYYASGTANTSGNPSKVSP